MVRESTARSRVIQPRTKVRTGCTTCRIRKIKCDEEKPHCRRCVGTGRVCDGYESLFQVITAPSSKIAAPYSQQVLRSALSPVTDKDIELLNHCLSTKTLFEGVTLNCDEEVKEILMASLTCPSITHAVTSLRALRKNLSRLKNGFPFVPQNNPSYTYGIQQYSLALKSSVFGSPAIDDKQLRSILLCCQMFISIEQIQSNYSAMARHMLGGLGILREFQPRELVDANKSMVRIPSRHLPPLDVFIIKLFAAPCKFLDPVDEEQSRTSWAATAYSGSSADFGGSYAVMSNMRRKLKIIAFSTSDFLHKPLSSRGRGQLLQHEIASLLRSLEVWLDELKVLQENVISPSAASLSISFMYLLHAILRVVLLGKLEPSPDTQVMLEKESEAVQVVADEISNRIRSFSQ